MDILCVSETWLTSDILDRILVFPGYCIHRSDRRVARRTTTEPRSPRGDGVAIITADNLRVTRLDLNESDPTVESLWLSVGGPGRRTVIVGVINRPPATPTARTLNILRAELQGAIATGKPVYVLGDFNINLLNPNGPGVRNFCAMLNDLSLHQLIDKPTHLHPIPTLLDLIVTNQTGLHDFVKILPEPVADHQPVLLCAPSQRQRRRPTTYVHRAPVGTNRLGCALSEPPVCQLGPAIYRQHGE